MDKLKLDRWVELLKCKQCGSSELVVNGIKAQCPYCGAQYIFSKDEQEYMKGRYYIERCREAQELGNGEIVMYSNEAIKYAPHDPEAWVYRISALLDDSYTEKVEWKKLRTWIAEAAKKAISLSENDGNNQWIVHEAYGTVLALAEANDSKPEEWVETLLSCINSVPEDVLTEDEKDRKQEILSKMKPH